MTDGYHISQGNEEKGPFTLEELTEMGIDLDTMVLSPGADDWQRAADLPEFFNYFEATGIYFPTEDNLAGFWWRLLAYFIDYFTLGYVLALFTSGITAPLSKKILDNTMTSADMPLFVQICLLNFLAYVFYHSALEASPLQGSLGKRFCGLVVVDADGRRLKYGRALSRNFSKFFSSIAFGVGYLSILWDDRKQAWHDKIAKTYVLVRNR
ncbi:MULTISPECIES: RDD family protein [unclassified Mucilaginibacter]|uniref:RDD family protein n=1 Tax=unclassified Mucilaginibacter TaxID=2617802 RepID=UPI002AC8DF86|nr:MULTISPECIES: RDD family protein [unclassified Mucilaginibacter]MEB0263714.1 RDD family protein [Mucilaginibacter sp. 10I4]MEB0277800.1 RDD family protein [Mucilaginibacter sp. 10B2]MEB0302955.1 RDD family protein [Mucilaginibacter sp. 5C4]WPX24576.1 RDD family protein [Mucilaginibacter sp. 5C4]